MKFLEKFRRLRRESPWKSHFFPFEDMLDQVHEMEKMLNLSDIDHIHERNSRFMKTMTSHMETLSDFYVKKRLEYKEILESASQKMNEEPTLSHLSKIQKLKDDISTLQDFATINKESIERILRKHDKYVQPTTEEHLLKEKLAKKPFVNEEDVLEDMKKETKKILKQLNNTLNNVSSEMGSPMKKQKKADLSLKFEIDPTKDTEGILKEYKSFLETRTYTHFGYPYNLDFRYDKLAAFLGFSINNLGDPFKASNYGVHSREFEIEVLNFFADLWKIPRDNYWGYVTTCGTEGNLHAILVARECFPDGILYASRESHYSVFKAARFYRMKAVPIPTLFTGEMDYASFEQEVSKNTNVPAIVNCNVGTTVKGGVDNVDKVIEILKKVGYTEDKFYIHCDGALFALMLPFVKNAGINVNFEKPISSMSVSGHKFMGSPMPSGIIIHRKENISKVEYDIEYLNSKDTTIMGSRNGQAPLFLWHTLRSKGREGFAKDVRFCMENAQFLHRILRDCGVSSLLNDLSNTVVLEKPNDPNFILKWQLACEKNVAHVVVMPNVTKDKILLFVKELLEVRKNLGGGKCIKDQVGQINCLCSTCGSTNGQVA